MTEQTRTTTVSRLVAALADGDPQALDALFPIGYDEIHALAHRRSRRRRATRRVAQHGETRLGSGAGMVAQPGQAAGREVEVNRAERIADTACEARPTGLVAGTERFAGGVGVATNAVSGGPSSSEHVVDREPGTRQCRSRHDVRAGE